jgi:hypothetical protein
VPFDWQDRPSTGSGTGDANVGPVTTGLDNLAASKDLAAFAQANGWTYSPTAAPPALGPSLWEQASSGIVRDKIAGPGWEAGRITGGSNSASKVEQKGGWTVTTTVSVSTPKPSIDLGYLSITLPTRLPNMILDAKSNDSGPFSSLLKRPKASQALSLEGDFDSHFRLFVPTGYERDALYVFTPDLMALLIDETGDLDVEIRDNQLIVYKPGGFDLADPSVWTRFDRIRETVGAKAWSQTDRYTDERAATLQFGDVAPEGRRLRKKIPRGVWFGLAFAGIVLVFVFGTIAFVISQVVFLR